MSTELEVVGKALVDIDAVAAGIAKLTESYGGVVFDVATTKGMEEAKAARLAIREPRYSVERIRKDAKRPLLDLGKKLDAEAARIERELLKIEGPIDEQIRAEDARKERERQARIEAEQQRVADLQERVAELRGNRTLSVLSGSALIADHISDIEGIAVDDSFEEFRESGEAAKIVGLQWLREIHAAALAHEAEQERIKAERAELAEAARQAEASRATREAEETQQRAERERLAAEQRKLAEERAEFERAQAEERRQREEEDRRKREKARLAGIKRPSDEEIVGVLAKHYNVPGAKVLTWLAASKWKKADAA